MGNETETILIKIDTLNQTLYIWESRVTIKNKLINVLAKILKLLSMSMKNGTYKKKI